MNRDNAHGRMERELRRRQLAMTLIGHQARTQTIEEFTGLTRHQLATLRRRAGVPTESRFRGPAPTAFDVFFSCARTRSESAVLAFLYRVSDASRFRKPDGSSEAAIERGEQLCEVYERWQHLVPSSQMEFEHLTLLGEGITRERPISFRHCDDCHAIILVDLLANQRRLCDHCPRARRETAHQTSERDRDDEETDLVLYQFQLQAGRLLRERKGSYTFDDGSPLSG
jgi:hypothetical protein